MTPDACPSARLSAVTTTGVASSSTPRSRGGSGRVLFHVRWDKSIEWKESPNHEAEIYQSCWVDDIDVEIVSEVKCG